MELADGSDDPHAWMEKEESLRKLRRLIRENLTDTETRAMVLHYAEELPLDAVSRMLGLENASGAKAYIVSAKRKLAKVVRRLGDGEGRGKPT